MKQHITKEQWNELEEDLKWKFAEKLSTNPPEALTRKKNMTYHMYPSIGQMIEFLEGKDAIIIDDELGEWGVVYMNKHFRDNELCDTLWEAVKAKLYAKTQKT